MIPTELPDGALLKLLRCPTSGQPLQIENDRLTATDGSQSYEFIEGIPILVPRSAQPTHQGYQELLKDNRKKALLGHRYGEQEVSDFLAGMLVPTCGNLFHGVRLAGDYPIPDFPQFSRGGELLDVGCSWGRWSIAGAKAGYRVIGVDVHLEALLCARWLSRRLTPDNPPLFVLADARYLPFAPSSFDGAFSYSVIQHFSSNNAAIILGEIARVMKGGAKAVVQMPNKNGLWTALTKRRSRSSEGDGFDVRYYSIRELLRMFESEIGKSDWYVDCFLGLNVHARDRRFVPASKKWIVDVAELLLAASKAIPSLAKLSDSVFISSIKT